MLGTYPPTQCGLATFSRALASSLASPVDEVGVVSIVDTPQIDPLPEVRHQWVRGTRFGGDAAAAALNAHDVAVVQHEYGIFGGRDGADVLPVVAALRIPVVLVLHTVLTHPTERQRAILVALAERSTTVVTMTRTAHRRLIELYGVPPGKIQVIPHGAADTGQTAGSTDARPGPAAAGGPVVLTWGLLGEGKGIEWAIEALPKLRDLRPRYRVVGQTHPRVLEEHGERYRDGLVARARRLGVADLVEFDARYLPTAELHRHVRGADVVLLPYDSVDQVTSGVLIEAVAAGKPVVSTGFPHARELLASGAGLIVPRQDPGAIADAVRRVLTEPGLAANMTTRALRIAPELLWPAVADRYRQVAAAALGAGAVLAPA